MGFTVTSEQRMMVSAQVMDSVGTPVRPLSVDQIQSKAQSLIDTANLQFDMADARETIWSPHRAQALVDLFTG